MVGSIPPIQTWITSNHEIRSDISWSWLHGSVSFTHHGDSVSYRSDTPKRVSLAVCGFGYWGPNIVRNLIGMGCDVSYIVDASEERRISAKEKYPDSDVVASVDPVLEDDGVDAVVIVLPVSLHHQFAKRCLLAGKNVLIEKPICSRSEDVEELISIAKERSLTVMVDHTYVYSPHIEYLKSHFEGQDLWYFDSERINLGKYQRDVNVIWDLAVHDLSILDFICPYRPVSVRAFGSAHTDTGLEDISTIFVRYDNDFIATIRVSWISPIKSRRLIIGGSDDMAIFDDVSAEKIKIYDSKVEESESSSGHDVRCIAGEVFVPEIQSDEVLSIMLRDFVHSFTTGESPRSDAYMGLRVVRMIEAAQESLRNGGNEVPFHV